jgi:hypothetical protein
LGHAQQLSIRSKHVSLASLFASILSRIHHAGNARDASKVHVYLYTCHGLGRCARQPRQQHQT